MDFRKVSFSVGLFALFGLTVSSSAAEVEKWKRFEISLPDTTWSGNPFDVELAGVFTSPSRRTLRQLGFFAGNDRWKIYFMPDEVGIWSYQTESPDRDLAGHRGSFQCTESGLAGQLVVEKKRWKLKDKGFDFPLIWNLTLPDSDGRFRSSGPFRGMDADDPRFISALDEAESIGVRLLGISQVVRPPVKSASSWPPDALSYVPGEEGKIFHIPFWDKMNDKLDRMRDRGIGVYIMLYSDDSSAPDLFGIKAQTVEEIRLFRYSIARFACYPIVLWDSGIDIHEYRTNEWIDWFVNWFNANDPWKHTVDSRSSGRSGKHAINASYWSDGATGDGGSDVPTRADLLKLMKDRDVPTAFTDHWRPYLSRGNWDSDSLRRAYWRIMLSGGQATFPDYLGGNTGTFSASEATILEGMKFIRAATTFFNERLAEEFDLLAPHDELIRSASAGAPGVDVILSAIPGRKYVLYSKFGGKISIDLSAVTSTLPSILHNPRTGELLPQADITKGGVRTITFPDSNDWVFFVGEGVSVGDGTPPAAPTNLRVGDPPN